jgi:hypothetical protein
MKKLIIVLTVALMALLLTDAQAAASKKSQVLRHVVSFKFKETATEAQVKKVVDDFRALKSKIHQIKSFEWGVNNSPEKMNKGLTHCFILTFTSEKDRDAYLVHPAHKAFGGSLNPVLADVMVIDFWAKP